MQLYLPIAEVSVNGPLLLSVGLVVGLLSGIFGVGGGFLITPLLFFIGIPPAVAVATSANQIVASSFSGIFAHLRRRTVDFRNVLIIMTSNLGSEFLVNQPEGQDSDAVRDEVMGVVRSHFRPEFINRIDEVVVFHGLDAKHIRDISVIQLKSLEKRLAERDLKLEVSEAALDELAKVGFDPLYGARPLKRAIQQKLENPIAKRVLEGRYAPNETIPVDFRDGHFTFEKAGN